MKKKITWEQAAEAAGCVAEDLHMLRLGQWVPDDSSIEASQDNAELVVEFLKQEME